MSFKPIPEEVDKIAKEIVDSAYIVHKELGPGLLEQVYEICFCHELKKHGLSFKRQVPVPINYDGIKFSEALRLDVLVNELVICELKTVERLLPFHTAQVLTYLKLTNLRLGLLINFNVPLIKKGIHRIVR
jgi:GxxExxY protein